MRQDAWCHLSLLRSDVEGCVDISLILSTCDSVQTIGIQRVPVRCEVTMYSDGHMVTKYDISAYTHGVFLDVVRHPDDSYMTYVAADVNDSQFSVVGTLSVPIQIPYNEIVLQSRNDAVSVRRHTDAEQSLPSTDAIVTTHHPTLQTRPPYVQPMPAADPSGPKVYALVHEAFFDENNTVPEQIGAWCVAYSWIDYSIYRERVSEAQIKSDLQFYNKKHYTIDSKSRIMGAYEIDTHGLTEVDEPDRALMTYDGGWLYPEEVKNLWGPYSNEYYIRPDETIVWAAACRSLFDSDENSGSEMGDAFIGYGARAYIGSIIKLPAVMDPWTQEFWWSLTYEDETINKAIYDANIAFGWAGTSFVIQVYLSEYGTRRLPN